MKLYLRYLSIHLKSMMQYKVSFFLTLIGQFIVAFTSFLAIFFLFSRFHQVEGFSFSEVLLCFGIITISFSLAELFARGFDTFAGIIGNGEFDRILVRPRSPVFQVLASRFELARTGKLIQAVGIFAYALASSGIEWTAGRVFTLIGMVVGGVALFSGLFLIYASICFFTLQGLEFMNIFTDGGREFGAYPLAVYGKGVLKFLTYVIPMACFQYYPLLYLIGRTENSWYAALPVFSVLFLLPCYGFWRFGLRHFKSTGS